MQRLTTSPSLFDQPSAAWLCIVRARVECLFGAIRVLLCLRGLCTWANAVQLMQLISCMMMCCIAADAADILDAAAAKPVKCMFGLQRPELDTIGGDLVAAGRHAGALLV